jgi:hypothetical protein
MSELVSTERGQTHAIGVVRKKYLLLEHHVGVEVEIDLMRSINIQTVFSQNVLHVLIRLFHQLKGFSPISDRNQTKKNFWKKLHHKKFTEKCSLRTISGSTLSGSSPNNPSKIAVCVLWPIPVRAKDPYSSTRTAWNRTKRNSQNEIIFCGNTQHNNYNESSNWLKYAGLK